MRHLRVLRVHGDLVLCSVADQTLVIGEGDIRRSCAVSLVVGDDLNTIVLPDTNASETKKKKKKMRIGKIPRGLNRTYE